MSLYSNNWKKNKFATVVLALFFLVSFIEIYAEYRGNLILIWIFKPLIIPLLVFYYVKRSIKINKVFLASFFFSWIANILFIQTTLAFIIYGVLFFILYRIIVIYTIVRKVKMPSIVPLLIGCIPFIFIYTSVTLFTYTTLGESVYLFLSQGIFTIFLGGFSLGNYILNSSKQNALLLLSTLFMTFTQFLFLLKFYFEEVNLIQAVAMTLFVFGQLLLTKYIFHTEKHKQKIDLIKNLKIS